MITLISFLTGISQLQAAPKQVVVNSYFSVDNSQVRGLDLEESSIRLSQVISIPELPELEPIEPEPAPEAVETPGNGNNSGGSSNRGREVRSGGAGNSRPRGNLSRDDDDDDDTSSRPRRGDNDDDDD